MANDILRDTIPNSTQESNPTEKKRQRKTSGIYKHGKRWRVDTSYKFVQLRESFATFEMAEAALRKMKTLIDEGRWLDKKKESSVTVGELIERYLKWCDDIRQKDVKSKKQRLGVVEEKLGKDALISMVTRAMIEQYQADRMSSLSWRNTPLKPATVNRELAALKHMLTKAVQWGILDKNPASGVKLNKENNRRLRYLTAEECKTLLDACSSLTLRQIVVLALNTGMRRGEILNLKWENVNFRERLIEVTEQKNGQYSTIPLNSVAVDTLRAIPRRLDSEYVFPGKVQGKPFYDLFRHFEKAVKAAKLEGVNFHTLRHTAASHLVMAGVDLATVQEIMRHKTITMTLRYSHLSPEHKRSAVDALQIALAGDSEKSAKTA